LPTDDDNIYDKQPSKKKRYIIIGIVVGVLILIGIILAIVYRPKKSGDGGGDEPKPPPFVPTGYNPYSIDNNSLSHDVDYFSGNIIFN
jgi:flagellar basal body-associated protein FliL